MIVTIDDEGILDIHRGLVRAADADAYQAANSSPGNAAATTGSAAPATASRAKKPRSSASARLYASDAMKASPVLEHLKPVPQDVDPSWVRDEDAGAAFPLLPGTARQRARKAPTSWP